jgi:hypothetical protein
VDAGRRGRGSARSRERRLLRARRGRQSHVGRVRRQPHGGRAGDRAG